MQQLKISQTITIRRETLNSYLSDIAKIPLITPDQEVELAARIQNGDEAALEEMVLANLRFVVSVAKQYQSSGLELCDLISEGNLGLIKAAQKFDATKGFKFISFAVWWIRQSIMAAISDQGRVVRLPMNRVQEVNRVIKAKAKFHQENGREATDEELAQMTNLEVDKVKSALSNVSHQVSVDAPFGEDGDGTLLDVMPDKKGPSTDSSVDYESLQDDIKSVLNILNDRDRSIIMMFYGIGYVESMDLDQIADVLDISRERVRQLKEKALRRLRKCQYSSQLRQHLG